MQNNKTKKIETFLLTRYYKMCIIMAEVETFLQSECWLRVGFVNCKKCGFFNPVCVSIGIKEFLTFYFVLYELT